MAWWKRSDGPTTKTTTERETSADPWWPFDELDRTVAEPAADTVAIPIIASDAPDGTSPDLGDDPSTESLDPDNSVAPSDDDAPWEASEVDPDASVLRPQPVGSEPAPAARAIGVDSDAADILGISTTPEAPDADDHVLNEQDAAAEPIYTGLVAEDSPEIPSDHTPDEATLGLVNNPTKDGTSMADHQSSLDDAMQIDGALGVALVDTASGMTLGKAGNPPINLDVAAAGNSSVVQAKLRTMKELGLNEALEDILITLQSQYHIIRTLGSEDGLFLYLVLDKERSNLAMARFKLAKIEKDLQL